MKKIYVLQGLDCANCAAKIEEAVKNVEGVESTVVDFMNLKLVLEFSEDREEEIISKVKMIIHELEPEVVIEETMKEENLKKEIVSFGIGFILFVVALVMQRVVIWDNTILSIIIFVCSYLVVGGEVVWKAIRNMIHKEVFDENFLMTIATIGAFLIGEYPEAVAVMLFYQLGEFFQKYAVNHSRKSIANLMDMKADYANVEIAGEIIKKDPNEVKVGDIIFIRPGEKVPLDGIVKEGTSYIDTKALTGESVPRKVTAGEVILSGCINQDSVLKVCVSSALKESTVSKILNLVENASSRKSESENFITKFAKYYTPIVVGAALLLAILPPLFIQNTSFSVWIYRALSFLVVSCPCALVVSIPLSFFGGIGAAAKSGILVKGSNYLEALSRVETVVFDKTGTLTEGIFEVQSLNAIGISEKELLSFVAYAESLSSHPIATSIRASYGKEIDHKLVTNVKELSGSGVIAFVRGKEVMVGNEKLMKRYKIKIQKCNEIGTVLHVAIDKKYVGSIVISDKIKKNASVTMETLKKIGIKELVMLTGDKLEIGKSVAEALKMDTVYAELLPDEKVHKMEVLLNCKSVDKKIAFVGDGINDAPVLALSDIGIAMGGLGSDAAIEAADVVIMTDDPFLIVRAICISNRTLRIVKQNIYFALVVKVMVLILSALGISTMWSAVFADVGVSILAILNALRLLRVK